MSRERVLLERAYYVLGELSYAILKDSGEYKLAGDIYEFLSAPKPEQDEEPTESYDTIDVMRAACPYHSNELRGAFYDGWMQREKLHPAPRPEFVRLSEEEIAKCLANTSFNYEFARAIEDALEERNK